MWAVILLIVAFVCLVLGSHWLVSSMQAFSIRLRLKPLFLSIVVLGFVSSSPEWFVTMTASFKNLSSAGLGNVIGSNLINILLVLALAGLFYGFPKNKQILRFDMPALIVAILLLGLCSIDQRLDKIDGLIFLSVFSFYIFLLFKKRKDDQAPLEIPKNISLFKAGRDLVLGFAVLFAGSSLAVDSSLKLVEMMGLTERFAGVFILSLSTSLPELSATLQAGFKKEKEMALGSIIGSNIFNTLFILGSASLPQTLLFSKGLYYDYFIMLCITLILWGVLFFKKIPKFVFALFIAFYFIYVVFVAMAIT